MKEDEKPKAWHLNVILFAIYIYIYINNFNLKVLIYFLEDDFLFLIY